MKLYQLSCPSCGAKVEVEENRTNCYCSYCGNQVLVDDGTKRIEIKYTDEAKIKEIESNERIFNIRNAAANAELKQNNRIKTIKLLKPVVSTICVAVLVIASYMLIGGYFDSLKRASNRQERELQMLVEEILEDIENHEFEVARVKAQTIDYTEGWSDEIDKKWDSMRKELLKEIDDAEKRWKKENRNKDTWWNPFD